MLVMMSGLPGAGKSALAEALAQRLCAVIVSVDPIEDAIVRSGLPMGFESGVAAYEVAATVARAQLANGLTVIADAANYLEVARAIWRRVAAEAHVPLKVVEVVCRDPALHQHRLAGRERGLTMYPEPTWDEVVARAEQTEPWPDERLVVDSAEPIELGIEAAVRYLGS